MKDLFIKAGILIHFFIKKELVIELRKDGRPKTVLSYFGKEKYMMRFRYKYFDENGRLLTKSKNLISHE